MSGMDVSTLGIVVKSDGVAQAKTGLDSIADSADKAERKVSSLTSSLSTLGTKQSAAMAAAGTSTEGVTSRISSLLRKLESQIALFGANNEATATYKARLTNATEAQVAMAGTLGKQVDALVQAAASTKELNKQQEKLAAAHVQAVVEDQRRAWKLLGQTQSEAIAMNKAYDASQKKLQDSHVAAIIEDQARAYKKLASAQAEGIAMNKAFDARKNDESQFLSSLKLRADSYGKNNEQLAILRATQAGYSAETIKAAGAQGALLDQHIRNAEQVKLNAKAVQAHTGAMRDAHDMARGLSGGLGALWLTYGNIAPMVAGVAISSSFMQAAKSGSEFAYQLTFVKALGGETAETMSHLHDSLIAMSKGSLQSPVELANGMRILSQAGLSARDAIMALPQVMNLAVVGEMQMEQAAITLTGVMNAFGLSTTDMGHIGDVFAKAAAVSQTSVIAMTEAMKTASVVGAQYGVSMEDAASALTLLAKMNITGTAAGTSFRNMLKELYAPGKEAGEMMKRLGIASSDSQGNLRGFSDVIFDLKGKIEQFDKTSQVNILQKLFGERGAKEAVAMLSLTKDKWNELVDSIKNSDGFMSNVTAELEMTTKGRFKAALNTMQANMIDAFDKSEGSVRTLANALRDLADSQEFKNGVGAIVGALSELATIIVKLLPLLINLAEAWVVFKGVGLLVEGIAAFRVALAGAGVAINAFSGVLAAAGTSLATVEMGLLSAARAATVAEAGGVATISGAFTTLFSGTGLVALGIVALGGLAYAFHQFASETSPAVKGAEDFTNVLHRQLEKIKEVNKELEKSLNLKLKNLGKDDVDLDPARAEVAKIQQDLSNAQSRMGVEGWSIKLNSEVGSLKHQLSDAQATLASSVTEQANTVKLNLRTLMVDMEKEADKLDTAAAKAGKKATTGILRQAIALYQNPENLDKIDDPSVGRGIGNYLNATLDDARMSRGDKHLTELPSKADISAAWHTKLTEIDGVIQEIQRKTKMSIEETNSLYKQGIIGDLEQIDKRKNAEIKEQQDVIEQINKKLALSAPKNAGPELEKMRNKKKEAEDAITKYEEESALKRNEFYAKFEQENNAIAIAGYKARGEYVKAFAAEHDKQYGLMTEHVNKNIAYETEQYERAAAILSDPNANPILLEAAAAVAYKASKEIEALNKQLDALNNRQESGKLSAQIKEIDFSAQNMLRSLQANVAAIEAETTDGSIISKLFKADSLDNLYRNQLPSVIAELEKAQAIIDANPSKVSDEEKKNLATRKLDYEKLLKHQRDSYKDFIDGVDKVGSEGFRALFDKTEGGWSAMTKKMRASFKTTLIDEIYKMLARPFVLNLLANIAGAAGATGLAGSLSQAANGTNTATGLVNAGSTAYSLYGAMQGYSAAYSTGAGLTATEAQAAADAYYAAGYYGTGASLQAGSYISGTTVTGTAAGTAVAGTAAEGGGSLMAGISSALSAIPVWGWTVMAIIATLAGSGVFDAGIPKVNINTGFKATSTGAIANPLDNGTTTYGGGQDEFSKAIYSDVVKGIVAKYDPSAAYDVMMGGHINIKGRSSNQDFAKIYNTDGSMVYNSFMESGKGVGDFQSWAAQEIPHMQLALITTAMRNAGGDVKKIADSIMGTATDLTETITKMSTDQTNQAMSNLQGFVEVFSTIKKNINKSITGDAVAAIVGLSGGMANLTASTNNYYQAYFSEAEKNKKLHDDLAKQFSNLNLVMPTTRTEFRSLVEGLDLSSLAGQEVFVKLMGMANSFGTLADYTASLKDVVQDTTTVTKDATAIANERLSLENQLLELQGNTTELRRRELAALDPSNRALQERIYALQDEADALEKTKARIQGLVDASKAGVDAAFAAVERAVDAAKASVTATYNDNVKAVTDAFKVAQDAAQEQIKAAGETKSAITSLASTLENAAKTIGADALSLSQRSGAIGLLQNIAKVGAVGGSLIPFSKDISEAIETLSKPSEDLYADFVSYSRDQKKASNVLATLNTSAQAQKSVAEMTLDALNAANDQAKSDNEAVLKVLEGTYNTDIKALDDQLASAQAMIDVLNGVDTSVKSVASAIAALVAAIAKANSANVSAGVGVVQNPSSLTAQQIQDRGTSLGQTPAQIASVQQGVSAVNSLNNSDLFWAAKSGASVTASQLISEFAPGWNPTSDQMAYWTNQIATNGATAAIAQFVNPQDQNAARIPFLNSHATGLERVPYDNYFAMLHEGEAVVDASSVRAIERYFGNPPAVVSNVSSKQSAQDSETAEEIRQLRAELQAANIAIAQNTSRQAKLMERWDGDGLPEVRVI